MCNNWNFKINSDSRKLKRYSTPVLTSAGDMVQNVFNNDEWGLSLEITLRINSNTYLHVCTEILRTVESVLNCAFEDSVLRLAHDCKF